MLAGLDGISRQLDPGEPLDVDIYELPEETLARIGTVPSSLEASLDALEADHEFLIEGDVFTAGLIEAYIRYKREAEVDAIRMRPHPWEFAHVPRRVGLSLPPFQRNLRSASCAGTAARHADSRQDEPLRSRSLGLSGVIATLRPRPRRSVGRLAEDELGGGAQGRGVAADEQRRDAESRQASRSWRILSCGPISVSCSTSLVGTAAAASSLCPPR